MKKSTFLLVFILFIYSCDDSTVYPPNDDPTLRSVSIEQLPNTRGGYHAKWSPDGNKIAYTVWPTGAANGKIFVYDIETKTSNEIVSNTPGDLTLSWSADSKQIIFDAYNSSNRLQLWIKNLETNSLEMITNSSSPSLQPDWLIESNDVIYHTSGYIYKKNMSTNTSTKIENTSGGLTPHCNASKDKIVYCTYSAYNLSNAIYTININGSNKTKLETPSERVGRPRWSPDSEYIIYEKFTDTETDLMIYDKTKNIFFKITSGDFPDWSPNGNKIVFANSEGLQIMTLEKVE